MIPIECPICGEHEKIKWFRVGNEHGWWSKCLKCETWFILQSKIDGKTWVEKKKGFGKYDYAQKRRLTNLEEQKG